MPDGAAPTPKSKTKTSKSKTTRKPRKPAGTSGLWSIKGIDNETRTKTTKAAKKRKETIGAYVNRTLLEAANNDLSSKQSKTEVGLTNEEMLVKMMEHQQKLTESQNALASKVEELVENQSKPFIKRVFG